MGKTVDTFKNKNSSDRVSCSFLSIRLGTKTICIPYTCIEYNSWNIKPAKEIQRQQRQQHNLIPTFCAVLSWRNVRIVRYTSVKRINRELRRMGSGKQTTYEKWNTSHNLLTINISTCSSDSIYNYGGYFGMFVLCDNMNMNST